MGRTSAPAEEYDTDRSLPAARCGSRCHYRSRFGVADSGGPKERRGAAIGAGEEEEVRRQRRCWPELVSASGRAVVPTSTHHREADSRTTGRTAARTHAATAATAAGVGTY